MNPILNFCWPFPCSLLHAAYQNVFEELAHVIEDRSDVRLQPTFLSEHLEGRLPFRRRCTQACWQSVSPPSIKGQMQCVDHSPPVKLVVCDQKSQIHQILHPTIRRASRKRVSVNLL